MHIPPRPPSTKGPAEWFTGDVWIDAIVHGEEPSPRSRERGPVRAWGPHRLALARSRPDPLCHRRRRPGAVPRRRHCRHSSGRCRYAPADEWHWHGATHDHFMTHLSITEGVGPDSDKRETNWGEHVTDTEYRGEA